MSKSLTALFLLVATGLVVGACAPSAAPGSAPAAAGASQPITLKAVSAWSEPSTNVGLTRFTEKINSRAAGKLKIDYVGGPEVVPPAELLKVAQAGTFDLVFTTPLQHAGEVAALQLDSYINPHRQRDMLADPEVTALMQELVQPLGLKYFGNIHAGLQFYVFTVRRPSTTGDQVTSLQGMRVRGTGPADTALISSMGGSAVAFHPGEVYEATQRGVVDAFILHPPITKETGLDEVAKFVIRDTAIARIAAGLLLMNGRTYDQLPKDLQELLATTAAETSVETHDYHLVQHNQVLDEIVKARGMQVLQPSPELVQQATAARAQILETTLQKERPELTARLKTALQPYYR